MNKEEQIIDLYVNQKCGQQECARKAHTSLRKVKEVLIKNNIHIRTLQESNALKKEKGTSTRMKPLLDWQKDKILEAYVEEKRGQLYTCKQAKCSQAQLKKFLKENNIYIRQYGEAAIESNKNRALYKNKQYFDTESSNMAWILGFLAADGYVSDKRNEISIGLSKVDREILERIREEIEIENKIRDYQTKDGFDTSELTWTCWEHKNKLAKYGIVPRKTFVLQPPYKLNEKYWIDYVRGYFDGDGSVNFISVNGKKKYMALRWQVCSAKIEILNFILDTFEKYGIPKVNIQKSKRKSPKSDKQCIIYSIQYSTNATKKIYKILYSTESNLFLKRKKEHFEEILQKI